MTEGEAAALYRLMTWLSPAFPVGAFAYSSGIEWAVEAGDIKDAASLRDWLAAMLAEGSGFCDGVFLAQAHRAASLRDDTGLKEVAELASAFVPSRERQLETTTQGRAFIDIARAAWNFAGLDEMIAACDGPIVYPVAVALSAPHTEYRLNRRCTRFSTRWSRTGFPQVPGSFRSARPTASACSSTSSRSLRRRQSARSRHRWTISAVRPFAPTSPACGTRRSTRGCSAHDEAHPPPVVAGTHHHKCSWLCPAVAPADDNN